MKTKVEFKLSRQRSNLIENHTATWQVERTCYIVMVKNPG